MSTIPVEADRLARRILLGAVVAELVLLVLNYVFNFFDVANDLSIRRIFNIAREQSLPTFFASAQAVAVGATALALWKLGKGEIGTRAWLFPGVFWVYVGIDDNAEVHERVGSALERASEGAGFVSAFPTFAWQLFLAPLLAAALLISVVIVWRRVERGRPLLVACLACFAVAQGLDFLEGIDGLFDGWAETAGLADYTVSHAFRATEEMLEMLGTTAFWAPTLWQLAEQTRGISVVVE